MPMLRPVPKNPYKKRKPKHSKRNNFSYKTRKQVYERDKGLCRECGREGTEVHHVRFRSQGGRGLYTNGLLLCRMCHIKMHQDYDLAKKWQDKFTEIYGPN